MVRKSRGINDILLGKYKIVGIINDGGMSRVYKVEDLGIGKNWCLKEVLKPDENSSSREKIDYESIIKEAQIMKGLSHFSIPRIVSMEDQEDSIFIIEDFIEGMSLKELIKEKGKLPTKDVIKWSIQICNVLDYLHTLNPPILYADMKPSNVLVATDGNIRLLDFGISSKLDGDDLKISIPLGTKWYAPKEQAKKGTLKDLRSDIYSMGKTMFEMATGTNNVPIDRKYYKDKDGKDTVDKGLEVIIQTCCEENPKNRYQTMKALISDLKNLTSIKEEYIKKLKSRIISSSILLGSSITLIAGSFIPLAIDAKTKKDSYESAVLVAEQLGTSEAYINAIKIKPTVLNPYFNYIDVIKEDGEFSISEEKDILSLINSSLDVIKQDKEYPKLAFEIGKLYWFYYNDGFSFSTKWFKDSLKSGYEKEESSIYYEIADFKKTIAMAVAEAEDKGLYKKYWGNLMKVKEYKSGELLELQMNKVVADSISNYSYRFISDGITKEDIVTEINRLKLYIKSVNPSSEKTSSLLESLKLVVDSLEEKLSSISVSTTGGDKDA